VNFADLGLHRPASTQNNITEVIAVIENGKSPPERFGDLYLRDSRFPLSAAHESII
jgi:hypothetical protein